MICNRIPAIAACLNCLRHIACFHRGSQSFRLLRNSNLFLCWPAGSLTAIFGGMVALPLAIRQSQCGIGTSGTPIFFVRSAFSCCGPSNRSILHQGHKGRTKSTKSELNRRDNLNRREPRRRRKLFDRWPLRWLRFLLFKKCFLCDLCALCGDICGSRNSEAFAAGDTDLVAFAAGASCVDARILYDW